MISKAGIGSRTEARAWIADGRVGVNGRKVLNAEQWVDLERDRITFDGKPVDLSEKRKIYLVLYKPKGYITTYNDPEGRPTVYDLIPGMREFVVPVGRLDLDTSGLLLMTNDTQFAERLTNPAYKVPKTYLIKASTRLTIEQMDRLRKGVDLDDGPTRPALVKHLAKLRPLVVCGRSQRFLPMASKSALFVARSAFRGIVLIVGANAAPSCGHSRASSPGKRRANSCAIS